MKNIIGYALIIALYTSACKDFLDVIPDNVATINHAFQDRVSAERYLYTCYSYLPNHQAPGDNPAFVGGDENIILINTRQGYFGFDYPFYIVRGLQNTENPYVNYWNGENINTIGGNGRSMFQALRDCNIFLDNIDRPNDLDDYEKARWVAEVKFLKAYYHYWLFQLYGPIPITDVNLPVNASPEQVRCYREPVDSVVNYIVRLLDEALVVPELPMTIQLTTSELGRVTKPIVAAVKAKTLVLAASPLFNGNDDYAGFRDNRGVYLFPEYDATKWQTAADACLEALEYCDVANIRLYNNFQSLYVSSPEIRTQMNIRGAVTERWNQEIVWGSTRSADQLQRVSTARTEATQGSMTAIVCEMAPTLRVAELFYTKNGIPINEDKDWNYAERYKTRVAGNDAPYYIRDGYTTANLHFDREPRFYATLGFDGGVWFGGGKGDDSADLYYIQAKSGQAAGVVAADRYSQTGYFGKKLVHYESSVSNNNFDIRPYSFPIIRRADLMLLRAEALLESGGSIAEARGLVDEVRARAGLQPCEVSWRDHAATRTDKPASRDGMLEITRQERLIELALEGQRFYDLRRWKQLEARMNEPLRGWNVRGANEADYYRVVSYYSPEFTFKHNLWPIRQSVIDVNKNIVQNPGWQ
ncbi:MAG: RagB/SusD family nutrient uptake outer membrane protein [Odoribacteraceae bacterium]|jgi:hypothetical protein|nr:RagB/SusD family nutrient uptake outer membrane protein [Odoribacteraceae bacterium]